jgi:hypothetical protein
MARIGWGAVIVGAVVLMTAGCASGATSSGTSSTSEDSGASAEAGGSEPAESSGDDAGTGTTGVVAACEAVTTGGYGLHSAPEMTVVPESGQVFGDGTPIAFRYTADGLDEYATFGYELAYIQDNGDAIAFGGAFFDADTATGEFSTANAVFDSDADGRPGIMTVTVTSDTAVGDDGAITGTRTELGQYCVTFEVE